MKEVKTVALIEESKLGEAIKSIKARGAKLDHDIHVAALSAVKVASKTEGTGNIHYVNALYAAMPKGARHVALTAWFCEFGGLMANEGQNKDTTPFVVDANKLLDIAGGQAMPWYTMKQSPKPDEVLDVLKLAMAALKRAKSPKEGQTVVNGAMIEKLEALCEEFAPADEVEAATE